MKVLNCAPEPELRDLRAVLMSLRNCDVVSPTSPEDAIYHLHTAPFDVLVVCHQFPADIVSTICKQFRQLCPKGKIVAIENPAMPVDGSADTVVSAHNVRDLLAAVTGVPYVIAGSK